MKQTSNQTADALVDPEYRRRVQGLKDVTAALNGEPSSPVVFSTDAGSVLHRKVAASKEYPEAFFDTNGMLRSWETADPMPQGWTGIAKRKDTLFVIGRERSEMSYIALQAKTMAEAREEMVRRRLLKSTPMVSKPNDFCAFNGWASVPYPISRTQAATGLLSMRYIARRGGGQFKRTGPGKYTLSGSDMVLLSTR